MPQFDPTTFASQLFWLAVTFVLLFIVVSQFAIPRLGEVLEQRLRLCLGEEAPLRGGEEVLSVVGYVDLVVHGPVSFGAVAGQPRHSHTVYRKGAGLQQLLSRAFSCR